MKVENRKTHSFFIRLQGAIEYDFCDRKLLGQEGMLVFIPKGASYTTKTLSESAMYTAIHFDADFPNEPQPRCYSLDDFCEADYMGSCFSDMWNFGTQSEKYRCLSLFYSLLSYLSSLESASNAEDKYEIIAPAIAYLKEHIYDCSLKVGKLHRLCGISNTYFRQLFTAKYGVTPQAYILSKRISHARTIISSGDYAAVGEVALSVGFNDPLYFSKAFKKKYGMPPSRVGKD